MLLTHMCKFLVISRGINSLFYDKTLFYKKLSNFYKEIRTIYEFIQPLNFNSYRPITPSVLQGVINLNCDHVKGVWLHKIVYLTQQIGLFSICASSFKVSSHIFAYFCFLLNSILFLRITIFCQIHSLQISP